MNKVEEIFKAWGIMFNPTDAQSDLAAARIEICNKCDSKKTIPFIHCSECGCALKAKVYSPVIDACPKGKWKVAEMKWQSEKDKKRYNDIHIT